MLNVVLSCRSLVLLSRIRNPTIVFFVLLIALVPCVPAAYAQRELQNIPVPDPELERQTFRVPEGFEVSLFAADPKIAKPIQMNFDEDGRLWIVSSEVYPQIKPGSPATDRVIVLEDTDHDGVSDKTHEFAGGLLIPTGIAPGDGGAYVANSTELLHFADTDGDLKADSKRVVLSGFGTEDTHHILHTLRWGYDGYLYFNQSIYIHSHIETPWGLRRLNAGGIWQFRPDSMELGILMRGLVNSWGHHFDRFGQSFATDGAGGEGINYVVPGAYYVTAANADRILQGLNPGSPKHCGLELVESPNLPPDWQGNAITCDFRGHRVVRFTLAEEGSGFVSREQQEVVWSDHVAFRPIDVKVGPDGAIYIADWYNPIIQHGEVDFRDERRDHTHGRIWRVRWTGAKSESWAPISPRSNTELFELLRSADGFQRQAARQILRQRGASIVSELRDWLNTVQVSDEEKDSLLLEALWCVQSARMVDQELLNKLLQSADGRIRAAAVRVLSHWKHQVPDSVKLLSTLVTDAHPRVRLEAVRAISFSPLEDSERQQTLTGDGRLTLADDHSAGPPPESDLNSPELIELALRPLKQPMDRFLDYSLWLTTRELSKSWMPAFQEGQVTLQNDADLILFAFSAVGTGAPIERLLTGLYAESSAPEQRAKLVRLIVSEASENQLGQLVSMAIAKSDLSSLQTALKVSNDRNIIPVVTRQEIESLISSEDDLLRRTALKAAGQWKPMEFGAKLHEIAVDPQADESDRLAVFQGISASRNSDLVKTLVTVASSSNTPVSIRSEALLNLLNADPQTASTLAGSIFSAMTPAESSGSLVRTFMQQKNGSELLMKAVEGQTLNSEIARDMLRALRESGLASPELEGRIRSAGNISSRKSLTAEQRAALLEKASAASAADGELVFRNEQLGCLKCHAIGGAGGLVGPDMVSLGASAQPDYLLDSLLDPNAKVKENYNTSVVVKTDGKVVSGIRIQESETAVTLRTAENTIVTIPKTEIEETVAGVSLMPEGLIDTLTEDELSSLVKFLSELGRTSQFTVSRQRFARTWEVLLPTKEGAHRLQRTSYAQAASDDPSFLWKSRYTTVAGDLPLNDIPAAVSKKRPDGELQSAGFARTTVLVTSPGKITFRLNDPTGLELRLGDKPLNLSNEFAADLPAGPHRLTLIIDQSVRKTALRLELMETPGSGIAEFRN